MREEQEMLNHLKGARHWASKLVENSEGDRRLSYKVILFSVEAALKAAETELKEEVACA